MSKICMGCGSRFQSEWKEKVGYIRADKYEEAIYCERCFRLKHYHERKNDELTMSNEEILQQAQLYSAPVYYFVDLVNLSEESIQWFRKITGSKTMVLTKIDSIPKSISIDKILSRIRMIYGITEEIIPVSIRREKTLQRLWNHCSKHPQKKVVFLGMTNVGKSSLLNQLSLLLSQVASPILVSEMPNTTQHFLSWNIHDVTIYDAPGFNYHGEYDSDFQYSARFKKNIRPITYPLKKETKLNFHSKIFIEQDQEQNYVTFYGNNDLQLERQYRLDTSFPYQENISLLDFQDIVFPGIGFFQFRNRANITIYSSQKLFFEIRNSLIGGSNDTD